MPPHAVMLEPTPINTLLIERQMQCWMGCDLKKGPANICFLARVGLVIILWYFGCCPTWNLALSIYSMCACVYLSNYLTASFDVRLKPSVRASNETWQHKMIKIYKRKGRLEWIGWISDSTREWFSTEERRCIGFSSHCWSVETLFHHSGHRILSGSRSRGARSHQQTWSCGRSRRSGHRPCGWPVAVWSLPRSVLPAPYSSRIADEASWLWETEKNKRHFTTSFKSTPRRSSRSRILIKH